MTHYQAALIITGIPMLVFLYMIYLDVFGNKDHNDDCTGGAIP
jgi:hypothetical protein